MHYQFFISSLAVLAAQGISVPNSGSDGLTTPYITFRSEVQTDTSLRYVTNSGVCETTPGVNQYSGYIEVGKNMSMWFWFFEARYSPENAPITLWLNGGPGCSSMIGLFQEHGPCNVNPDGKTTYLNPHSWNNVSNVIYMDQPINAGFSYGTVTVNSTEAAAPFLWKALQILFESWVFSKYASREYVLGMPPLCFWDTKAMARFIFATESYGGHYVPSFVTYFHEQNALIAKGEIEGEHIIVSALMINNGWTDPLIQWKSIYNFTKHAPGYGQLQPDGVLANISDALYGHNGCVAQASNCYAAGNSSKSNGICFEASTYCGNNVLGPGIGGRDPYDLRQNSSKPFPPEYYRDFLQIPEVMKRIGAESKYTACSGLVYRDIIRTGDFARTFLPQLSKLANAGLKILVWASDADIICNWLGVYNTALAMDWYGKETLHNTPLKNITLHGTTIAAVANVDNFSFATVYAAGHEIAAFQPAAALEIFTQVVKREPLHSV